jgi:outer membrane protein assembly factor BamA
MYVRAGPVGRFDYLDSDGLPRSGGMYTGEYLWYRDQQRGLYSFRRATMEAQQYVPLFHKTHVLAFRARTTLSYAGSGQIVPFYMQPVLGGDDLRGFRPLRFYGNSMEVASAEYRWSIFSGLDLAAFYDTGKVFQKTSDLGVSHLEHSAGFGVRFLTPGGVALRVDTGFSREGFQVLIKFDNVWTNSDNRVRGW